jgi:hypothetical protein
MKIMEKLKKQWNFIPKLSQFKHWKYLKYGDGSEGHPIPEPAENVQHAHFVIDNTVYSVWIILTIISLISMKESHWL